MPPVLSRHRDANITKEQDNFLRYHILLFDIGTKCVRKVFDRELHPTQLKAVLNTKRFVLPKILSPDQHKLLYPPRGAPKVTSVLFDMTLMMLLLKHLGEQRISDTFPFETNHSIEADLSRLKCYRNLFSHLPTPRIDNQTYEKWSKDILQIIERLGGHDWIEECEQIRVCGLDSRLNDVKFLLLQLFIILHTKGYDMASKVSEKFWSFLPTQQLHCIFSLLEFHFWIFPSIYILWNEFQDSYHEDSDIKFFKRTECRTDKHNAQYDDCYPSSSPVTGTEPLGESHIIEIECLNCSNINEQEGKVTEEQKAENIIRMTCHCRKRLVDGEICFITLFTQLDPRLFRHDNSKNNADDSDHHTIFRVRDCTYRNEETSDTQIIGKENEKEKLSCVKKNRTTTETTEKKKKKKKNQFFPDYFYDYESLAYSNSPEYESPGNGPYSGICGGQNNLN